MKTAVFWDVTPCTIQSHNNNELTKLDGLGVQNKRTTHIQRCNIINVRLPEVLIVNIQQFEFTYTKETRTNTGDTPIETMSVR
jgi:hypothetical protein